MSRIAQLLPTIAALKNRVSAYKLEPDQVSFGITYFTKDSYFGRDLFISLFRFEIGIDLS